VGPRAEPVAHPIPEPPSGHLAALDACGDHTLNEAEETRCAWAPGISWPFGMRWVGSALLLS
jgi:hypothetical protein